MVISSMGFMPNASLRPNDTAGASAVTLEHQGNLHHRTRGLAVQGGHVKYFCLSGVDNGYIAGISALEARTSDQETSLITFLAESPAQ